MARGRVQLRALALAVFNPPDLLPVPVVSINFVK
jgi:hypothetical protein